ncbi:hypothetical protein LJC47_04485 [Desulfosarcina sp. OttesenSCG-928-B08]|nr:hypothetical protein [Desulfosarcina sp. OttesenSCG-928-B08]
MSFDKSEKAKNFSEFFGTLMIIVQSFLAVIWPYFLHIAASYESKNTADFHGYIFLMIQMFLHCLVNIYGWFCIKKMRWRRGMLCLAITGSLLFIGPILKIFIWQNWQALSDPLLYMYLIERVRWSYWDVILLSLIRGGYALYSTLKKHASVRSGPGK